MTESLSQSPKSGLANSRIRKRTHRVYFAQLPSFRQAKRSPHPSICIAVFFEKYSRLLSLCPQTLLEVRVEEVRILPEKPLLVSIPIFALRHE